MSAPFDSQRGSFDQQPASEWLDHRKPGDWTSAAAPATLVNRTHRVIHQRAAAVRARRSRLRALFLPMLICAAILVIVCTAVWSVLDQYDLNPTGIPDASSQMLVFLLWFFPVSAGVLALVWFRRAHGKEDSAR